MLTRKRKITSAKKAWLKSPRPGGVDRGFLGRFGGINFLPLLLGIGFILAHYTLRHAQGKLKFDIIQSWRLLPTIEKLYLITKSSRNLLRASSFWVRK